MDVVRAYQMEHALASRYRDASQRVLGLQLLTARLRGGVSAGMGAAGLLAFLFSFSLGAVDVARGTLRVGDLLAFVTLMQELVQPMMSLSGQYGRFQSALAAAERIFRLLDTPLPAVFGDGKSDAVRPDRTRTNTGVAVRMEQVSFWYDPPTGGHSTRPALTDVAVDIPAGARVAWVGHSGAGKTTLFKLLLGLYSPTLGRILIDGRPMNQLSECELRALIAYVPQQPFIFNGSLRENLRIGNPEAGESDLRWAAKAARVDEFAMNLPRGYDTQIGETGVKLSGGQRQRVAIARALLRDAPIVLLDEPTSALDVITESAVQDAMLRLTQGRTTMIIAHRLSSIRSADWIVVLDHGRVVEQGPPEQLLRAGSVFRHLWNLQGGEVLVGV
ncbi:MAG: ABC transporter ATP-binding protein/permease, partial [Alicyclobacillus herbarius]|uniref:ABC transporter ATP-binding protein n=1 Tax=Alicyclobacillus herbarius TaxID=122960 RepID=UPI00235558EE